MNMVARRIPQQVCSVVEALGLFGSWGFSQPPVDVTGDETADAYLAGTFSSLTRVRDTESRLTSLECRCAAMQARDDHWATLAVRVMLRWHADIFEAGVNHV